MVSFEELLRSEPRGDWATWAWVTAARTASNWVAVNIMLTRCVEGSCREEVVRVVKRERLQRQMQANAAAQLELVAPSWLLGIA